MSPMASPLRELQLKANSWGMCTSDSRPTRTNDSRPFAIHPALSKLAAGPVLAEHKAATSKVVRDRTSKLAATPIDILKAPYPRPYALNTT